MIEKLLLLEEIGKAFMPKRFRPGLRNYLMRAGITEVRYKLFGALFWLTFLTTALVYIFRIYSYLVAKNLNQLTFFLTIFIYWLIFQGALILTAMFTIYLYTEMKIYDRTKKMEDVLQDFLRFVSENLKGGMSFENALWSAIRPEFGILANEVRLAAKKVMTGNDVDEALNEFTAKYNSPMLKRSFDLIIEGLKGGGRIAGLIDRIVENIEETKELKSDLATTNLTYIIFVSFVTIFIAPLLFALSAQFLNVLTSFSERVGSISTQSAALPIAFGKMTVNPHDFNLFARYALTTTAFFSSMIVAQINKGNIKESIKFMPFFIIGTLVVHKLLSVVLNAFFGGLFF